MSSNTRARKVGHAIKEFFIGGRRFCCCIPNRFGVIAGSFLTFLFAGALSIIIWFELSTGHDMTFSSSDRTDFILGGILETLLFLASVLGFIGGIVRKQLFVTIYCYFLYVHFLANLGVASFLMWKINHTTSIDISLACHQAIKDPDGSKQCAGLLNDTRGVLIGIIVFVLLIEFYGALIVTRYMRQLEREKIRTRNSSDNTLLLKKYAYIDDDLDVETPYDPHKSFTPSSRLSATYFPTMPHIPTTPQTLEHERSRSAESADMEKYVDDPEPADRV